MIKINDHMITQKRRPFIDHHQNNQSQDIFCVVPRRRQYFAKKKRREGGQRVSAKAAWFQDYHDSEMETIIRRDGLQE